MLELRLLLHLLPCLLFTLLTFAQAQIPEPSYPGVRRIQVWEAEAQPDGYADARHTRTDYYDRDGLLTTREVFITTGALPSATYTYRYEDGVLTEEVIYDALGVARYRKVIAPNAVRSANYNVFQLVPIRAGTGRLDEVVSATWNEQGRVSTLRRREPDGTPVQLSLRYQGERLIQTNMTVDDVPYSRTLSAFNAQGDPRLERLQAGENLARSSYLRYEYRYDPWNLWTARTTFEERGGTFVPRNRTTRIISYY